MPAVAEEDLIRPVETTDVPVKVVPVTVVAATAPVLETVKPLHLIAEPEYVPRVKSNPFTQETSQRKPVSMTVSRPAPPPLVATKKPVINPLPAVPGIL